MHSLLTSPDVEWMFAEAGQEFKGAMISARSELDPEGRLFPSASIKLDRDAVRDLQEQVRILKSACDPHAIPNGPEQIPSGPEQIPRAVAHAVPSCRDLWLLAMHSEHLAGLVKLSVDRSTDSQTTIGSREVGSGRITCCADAARRSLCRLVLL